MKNKNIMYILVFLSLFAIFMAGCKAEEKPVEKIEEEVIDTGVLVVSSFPSEAQVYVDNELKGNTPFTLYNVAIGQHNVVLKREGYMDFEKNVVIKVGRTEEIDVTLTPIKVTVEEKKPTEEVAENVSAPTIQINKINLSSFAMYFDFDKVQFSEIRTPGSDIFSRKYDIYVHFTALSPTKIYVLNKPINEVKKEDCIFAETTVAPVFSKQTLCVKTDAGAIVAIGGTWQTSPDQLEWVLLG